MARYYCEYCHSYLTHDTLSVRKSHLIGKNHLRITADYYRNKKVELDRKTLRGQTIVSGKRNRHHRSKENPKVKNDIVSGKAPATPIVIKRPAVHCLTRREKKAQRRVLRQFYNELDNVENRFQILKKLYKGSPGYSRVFIESNRFDVGDLIRAIRLPQRANVPGANNHHHHHFHNQVSKKELNNNTTNSNLNSNATTEPNGSDDVTNWDDQPSTSSSFPLLLPPPPVLSQWSSTIPKTSVYNGRSQVPTTQHRRVTNVDTSYTHSSNRPLKPRARFSSSGSGERGEYAYKRRRLEPSMANIQHV